MISISSVGFNLPRSRARGASRVASWRRRHPPLMRHRDPPGTPFRSLELEVPFWMAAPARQRGRGTHRARRCGRVLASCCKCSSPSPGRPLLPWINHGLFICLILFNLVQLAPASDVCWSLLQWMAFHFLYKSLLRLASTRPQKWGLSLGRILYSLSQCPSPLNTIIVFQRISTDTRTQPSCSPFDRPFAE